MRKLINVFCVIYLNDILIYNSNSTKYWQYMRLIFERFKQYQLYVNLKKCEFVITKIEFLNFIVFIKNVQMNSKKIRIIQKWSLSKNYREFQIFLKFVNYYKRFIKNYFKLFVFFIDLLKKNKNDKKFEFFQWFDEQKQTFRKFRKIFISIFILYYYYFIKKINIKFDVFNFVVVNIINQQNQFENWRSMTF